MHRVKPAYERHQINAALVQATVEKYKEELAKGIIYILDGARNINHETDFQDYLEEYFIFRKAYCQLHIRYNPLIRTLIKILYLFRNTMTRFDKIGIIHNINAVLKMEHIRRQEEIRSWYIYTDIRKH